MLEAEAPRQDVRSEILEVFGAAESRERVAQDVEKRGVEEGEGAIAFAIPAEGGRKRFITRP
jgi:hypothetical protein